MRDPRRAEWQREALAIAQGVASWQTCLPCPKCGTVGSAGAVTNGPAVHVPNPKGLRMTVNWGELKCLTCGHFTNIGFALAEAIKRRANAYEESR